MMPTATGEYFRQDAPLRYRQATAGRGANHLVAKVYGPLLIHHAVEAFRECADQQGASLLEFGCGAAMNLLSTVDGLAERGVPVREAYGTDFSDFMVTAAQHDMQRFHTPRPEVRFLVANNDTLASDVATGLDVTTDQLNRRFHLIFGVNTFRYAWRSGHDDSLAHQIADMLTPGGRVVIVDMNSEFPYFLKALARRLSGAQMPDGVPHSGFVHDVRAILRRGNHLPTLAQYTAPWRGAGLHILESRTFCWIPHSSRGLVFAAASHADPVLDRLAPHHAMRSLVVARKPAGAISEL